LTKVFPYRPQATRVQSVATTLVHNSKKYHIVIGYDTNYDPRVVRIFPSFKIGTDMSYICQHLSNLITKQLQFFEKTDDALQRLLQEEPKQTDGSPTTIVGTVCLKLLENKHV